MGVKISVWQDEQGYRVGIVKGSEDVIIYTNSDREKAVEHAANVAIKFDLVLYVMGRLADAYEIRDES